MVDLHHIVGSLQAQLEQVGLLDVVPVLARWLRDTDCHRGSPGCHDRSLGHHAVIQAALIVQYATTWKIRKKKATLGKESESDPRSYCELEARRMGPDA